jgi:hypothetical protein
MARSASARTRSPSSSPSALSMPRSILVPGLVASDVSPAASALRSTVRATTSRAALSKLTRHPRSRPGRRSRNPRKTPAARRAASSFSPVIDDDVSMTRATSTGRGAGLQCQR